MKKNILFAIVIMTFLLTGCSPSASPNTNNQSSVSQDYQVEIISLTEPVYQTIRTEEVDQPNCQGTGEVDNIIERTIGINHSIELGLGLTVDVDGKLELFGTGVDLGAAISSELGYQYGLTESISRSIVVRAAPKTHMIHKIKLSEIWESGTARVTANNQSLDIPFQFRASFSIDLLESIPVSCETGQVLQPRTNTTESIKDIFQDEFNTDILNSEWKWTNEDKSHWNLTVIPGSLQIITQRGDIYGNTNNLRNLLLQATPDGNFLITTLMTIVPNAHAQQGGIIIYQDDDNFIRLTRGYMFQSNSVEFIYEKNSVVTGQRVDVGNTTIYLSVSRQEDIYTGSYSLDGITWIPIGIYSQVDLGEPKVGISAWNGDLPAEEIPVNFDFVKISLISE